MKKVTIIQARDNSTRLPGKCLLPIGGTNALQMIVDKCNNHPLIDQVIVATTNSSDNIIDYCLRHKIDFWCDTDEDDVFNRVRKAAKRFEADIIIDITADCPFIDLRNLKEYIEMIEAGHDYCSNVIERTFPDGLDLQVYTLKAMEKLQHGVLKEEEHQHTGWNFTRFPEQFSLSNIKVHESWHAADKRITLDTAQDYAVINLVHHFLGDNPAALTLINFMDLSPCITQINSTVNAKTPGEL